jgi:hypothetical protein
MKIAALARKVPCPSREDSLRCNGREFTASHWNDCVNHSRIAKSAPIPKEFPTEFAATREFEDHC